MKKFWCLLLSVALLLSFTACDSESADMSDVNSVTEEVHASDSDSETVKDTKDEVLFTTEYNVEDYVENAIVVSKNDGLLYGLLDNNGNEVIPVKYDAICLLNKEEYVSRESKALYILAEYESDYIVFDIEGNEIFTADYTIEYIDTAINCGFSDNEPIFYETVYNSNIDQPYNYYNAKGELVGINPGVDVTVRPAYERVWITRNLYFDYNPGNTTIEGVTFCDCEGNEINTNYQNYSYISFVPNEDCCYLFLYERGSSYKYIELLIDSNETISLIQSFDSFDEYTDEHEKLLTEHKDYNLYESNSTWKLEDLEGNTLYDERYYEAFEIDGENDCYGLLNEDNQILLIGKTGVKYIDYGVLETQNNGDSVYMLCGDSNKTVNEIFEGKSSVIIPISSSGYYDIYYFLVLIPYEHPHHEKSLVK